MDFFCGSGTTLIAAQELGRQWIGIDKSEQAIKATRKKLDNTEQSLFECVRYDFIAAEKDELKAINL